MIVRGSAFFIFSLLLFPVLSLSQINISERVGFEIDPLERNYFFIFPDIADFQSAQLFRDNDSSFYFLISTETLNKKIDKYIYFEKTGVYKDYKINYKVYADGNIILDYNFIAVGMGYHF